jgi:hypothetical protein
MNSRNIFIFVAVLTVVAVKLYQKYNKKGNNNSVADSKTYDDSKFSSSSKEDEYEPYSKK